MTEMPNSHTRAGDLLETPTDIQTLIFNSQDFLKEKNVLSLFSLLKTVNEKAEQLKCRGIKRFNSYYQNSILKIHLDDLYSKLSNLNPFIPDYIRNYFSYKPNRYKLVALINLFLIITVIFNSIQPAQRMVNPLISPWKPLTPIKENEAKGVYEVFGFAPFWNIDKLDLIDFNVLTTLAYFGVDVDSEGNLDRSGSGYQTFASSKATRIFKKAHQYRTRVVLTLTQMDNATIRAIMDNQDVQRRVIEEAVAEVKNRGVDGVNIDFEYSGDPGQEYRDKFTAFVAGFNSHLKNEIPDSRLSVSVYASAIKEPKIYDIEDLGKQDIKIFMMAYDFGYSGSDQVIPTSPLYGHKSGKYWYDVSTAVEDFLVYMPPHKLILGNPWYGYNYPIAGDPVPKADAWGRGKAQTYEMVAEEIRPDTEGIYNYQEGWDEEGKVSWRSYFNGWNTRMIFIDDPKSLAIKYEFAKEKNLAGVGVWALGNEGENPQMWQVLKDKFGSKSFADNNLRRNNSGQAN